MRNGTRGRVGLAMLGVATAIAAVTLAPLPPDTGLALAQDETAGKAFQVDPTHSSILFGVKHLGVSYVYGRFNKPSGQFALDPANPKDSTIEVTIDVESVDTGDEGRDKHLRGSDFFNAKVFPTATFKSASIKSAGDDLEMTGDLTIHGVTKRITVPLEFIGQAKTPRGGERAGFQSEFWIKRSDFGINYMPEGLGDDVRMIIAVEGIRK